MKLSRYPLFIDCITNSHHFINGILPLREFSDFPINDNDSSIAQISPSCFVFNQSNFITNKKIINIIQNGLSMPLLVFILFLH